MRIRFVAATSIVALAVVACSSVVNGSGRVGSGGPGVPSSSPPTVIPSSSSSTITGFPSVSSSVPVPSSSSFTVPTPSLSTSPLPSISVTPPAGQTDFKCPYIVYPYAHLSFVCVADKMKKSTKDKIWPLVERKVVSHYGATGEWTLDTGAGHWGSLGSDSLRSIATQVRTRMLENGNYGTPQPAIRSTGKQVQIQGHKAFQLVTTFTINSTFRQTTGVKIKHEKSWILAIEVAPNDVSLWYVSVPDAVSYYWPIMDSLISTISVS